MLSYSSADMVTAWKNSHFILSVRVDFHMIDNLSKAAHGFLRRMLAQFSIDEILLPKYVKWSNFRSLLLNVEMAPSFLKHMNSVLSKLM